MIELDPPLFANPTNDPYWQGPVTIASNSMAIANGMIADQLARLKAENADLRKINSELGDEVYELRRQSSRIAFLEAALETAQAEAAGLRAMLVPSVGGEPASFKANEDFWPVSPDSPYYAREIAPKMREIEENAAASAFDFDMTGALKKWKARSAEFERTMSNMYGKTEQS